VLLTGLVAVDGLWLDGFGERRNRVDDAVGLYLLIGDEAGEPESQEAGSRVPREQEGADEHQRRAEDAARDDVGDLLVHVLGARRAPPAESDDGKARARDHDSRAVQPVFAPIGFAGDRATVETVIEDVGLRPIYLGEDQEALVDALFQIWISLALKQGRGRRLAFRLIDH